MEKELLIKALRYCGDCKNICTEIENCGYYGKKYFCQNALLNDAADALEAAEKRIAELEKQEPTEKQVVDYCHKRCFVVVDGELFQRMKKTFSQLPKEGEWMFSRGDGKTCVDGWTCSACGNSFHTNVTYFEEYHYCPNCGAKMDGETEYANTYSLGKIEMPKGAIEQIIADGERKDGEG